METKQALELENMRLRNANLKLDNELKELMLKEYKEKELDSTMNLLSNEEYCTQGFQQFVEKDQGSSVCSSLTYAQWYQGLIGRLKRMEFMYDNYLFCKVEVRSKIKGLTRFITSESLQQEVIEEHRINLHAREAGWTHDNTKNVLVLHPLVPDKTMELFPYKKSLYLS